MQRQWDSGGRDSTLTYPYVRYNRVHSLDLVRTMLRRVYNQNYQHETHMLSQERCEANKVKPNKNSLLQQGQPFQKSGIRMCNLPE